MAKKLAEVRKDFRSAEGTKTTELNNKSNEVKNSLYTLDRICGLLTNDATFLAYCAELAKAEPEFKVVYDAWDKNDAKALLPTCMVCGDSYGELVNWDLGTDGKHVARIHEGYEAPKYLKTKTKAGKVKYVADGSTEMQQYDWRLEEIANGKWTWEKFRKVMEQGWRFKGIAPNAKQYSLTPQFSSEHDAEIEK